MNILFVFFWLVMPRLENVSSIRKLLFEYFNLQNHFFVEWPVYLKNGTTHLKKLSVIIEVWCDASLRGMKVTAQLIWWKRKPPKIFFSCWLTFCLLYLSNSQVSFPMVIFQSTPFPNLTYTLLYGSCDLLSDKMSSID